MKSSNVINFQSADIGADSVRPAFNVKNKVIKETTTQAPQVSQTSISNNAKAASLDNVVKSLQVDYGAKVELSADNSGRIIVRIMSNDGRRVLRQMPPEALIKLHANMKGRGLLADWLA
jgi:uncharacterized FlaG/YvyC family protein